MANIVLRESLFGTGLVGSVDFKPTLGWADRQALENVATEMGGVRQDLRGIGAAMQYVAEGQQDIAWAVATGTSAITASLAALERDLGLRLDEQTDVLEQQIDLLSQIHETLRTPAKTRAAERIADTAELLRRGRFDRALSNATSAIEDDPNNAAGFRAAGWAALGLGQLLAARDYFVESGAASDGDERAEALRQAARIAYLVDDATSALTILAAVDDRASRLAARGVAYDRALYCAESGNVEQARKHLHDALDQDARFVLLALEDEVVAGHPELVADAREHLETLVRKLAELRRSLRDRLDEATVLIDDIPELLPDPVDDGPASIDSARGRADLHTDLEAVKHNVDEVLRADRVPLDTTAAGLEALRGSVVELLVSARRTREIYTAVNDRTLEYESQRGEREAAQLRSTALHDELTEFIAGYNRRGRKTSVLQNDPFSATVHIAKAFLAKEESWLLVVDTNGRVVLSRQP